jgi:cytochrome c-type biogenesis protein CcmH
MTPLVLSLLLAAGQAAPAALEREAREIEAMLMAPCCFSQQVSVHRSDAARQTGDDIRRRLAAGQTREQILDAYVAQYGARVLAEPRSRGFARLLFLLPPLLLLAASLLLAAVLRRYVARPAAGPAPPDLTDGTADRIDDELAAVD